MDHPVIEELVYDPSLGPLRYLWLQYIGAVDLDQHCKKSFVGTSSQRVATRLIQGSTSPVVLRDVVLDEGPAQAYYLCGVSSPYVWANNVHLAFVYDPDGCVEFAAGGVRARIRHARQVPIVEDDVDRTHPKYADPHFSTCRNWQFAWTVARLIREG